MRFARPLFKIDPGWCFLIAGLTLLGLAVVIPEQAKVHQLRNQLAAMKRLETAGYGRMEAYVGFRDAIEGRDESLMRRLAASQLNLMPQGTTPVLVATSIDAPVTEWIDSTLPEVRYESEPFVDSLISRWLLGPWKLWLIGVGATSVLVGVLMGSWGQSDEGKTGLNPDPG